MAPLQAKVLLLGDSGVGKTCLRQRYLSNTFTNQFKASIGADFVFKKTTALQGTPDEVEINMQVSSCEIVDFMGLLHNGDHVQASAEVLEYTTQILDAAGQERFRSLAQAFYRGADACIICFSVAEPSSLKHVQSWLQDFVERVDMASEIDDLCFVAVGTKSDLPSAVPVETVLQQLNDLLPGSQLAAQQRRREASTESTESSSSTLKVNKPEPQPVQSSSSSSNNTSRSRRSSQSAALLSSRTRKISSTSSSNFSDSIYHTPAGSISTMTPDSFRSSSLSTIRARSDSSASGGSAASSSTYRAAARTEATAEVGQATEDRAAPPPTEAEASSSSEHQPLEDQIATAFTLFYTSSKTGEAVADPFNHIATQLALRLAEKRRDQEWARVDDDELEQVGMTFTLRNVTSRNHIMLDHHDDYSILPLKSGTAEDSKTGWTCC